MWLNFIAFYNTGLNFIMFCNISQVLKLFIILYTGLLTSPVKMGGGKKNKLGGSMGAENYVLVLFTLAMTYLILILSIE